MNTNIQNNLNQFQNYDLLIISDCLLNSNFIQNYVLEVPLLLLFFKQMSNDQRTKNQYLIYNSDTTYLTILNKICEFSKNPYANFLIFNIFYLIF